MTYEEAKHILRDNIAPDGSLSEPGGIQYLHWNYSDKVIFDGEFSIKEITAIATYINQKYHPDEEISQEPLK